MGDALDDIVERAGTFIRYYSAHMITVSFSQL